MQLFPAGLDPARNEEPDEIRIYSGIYESLLTLGDDYQTIYPGLARSWEISPDQSVYTFHLQPGIRFHDGSPLNSRAVVYAFQRQVRLNPEKPLFNMIGEIRPADSLSLEIRLKYPYAQFLYTLTSDIGLKVISLKALEELGDQIAFHPSGTGPYRLKTWKQNREIRLEAFGDYHGEKGGVREIVFSYVPEYFEREELFREGKIDVHAGIPGYSIDRLRWQGKVAYETLPPTSTVFLGMNSKSLLFSDIRLRRAVLHALDIPRMVNSLLRGNSMPARGPLPPGLFPPPDPGQDSYSRRSPAAYWQRLVI